METIEKIYDLNKFKAEIKVAAGYQTFLKNQRKTVKLIGNRKMSVSDAAWKHRSNRCKLAEMYVAYGVMRGKDLDEQIKSHVSKKEENSWMIDSVRKQVEKYLEEYKFKQKEVA